MDLAFTNCRTHEQHGRQTQWNSISSPLTRSRAAPVLQRANVCPASEPLPIAHAGVSAKRSTGPWQGARAHSRATEPREKTRVPAQLDHAMTQLTGTSSVFYHLRTLCKVFCLPDHLLHPPACLPQLSGLKVGRDVREWSYFQEDEER